MFFYHAAPVLRGAKVAALITLKSHYLSAWRERQNALRKATGLLTLEMQTRHDAVLLLIYDEAALHRLVQDPQANQILAESGYPAECDVNQILSYLQTRISGASFPHEIGVFLGYPPEDVQGFIESGGKNCLCCRHWKVYHNVERALEMFRRIDEAHDRAIEILCKPMPLHVAAKLLKAS
jgi:hypothetical protein